MEDELNNLKNEDFLNLSSETESIISEDSVGDAVLYPFIIKNDILLVRLVPEKWIRPNNTIISDAYRPKKKTDSETGFEKNVSTVPRLSLNSEEELRNYKSFRKKHKLFQMKAKFPNEKYYQCIQDKERHIGITGDMTVLFEDEQSLEHFANNSQLLYPLL